MEGLVVAARIVLLVTALFCLVLSGLYVSDAVRAIVAQRRLSRGDYSGALRIYQRLLAHPWQPYTRRRAIAYNAAVCLHRYGDLEACRHLLERLLREQLDPTLDALGHALLGQTLVLLGGDLDRAEASLAKAGAMLEFSHFGLTRAILNLLEGDMESARRDFEAYRSAGATDPLVGRGTLALVERDFELTMNSYLLGVYHLLTGDPSTAHECLARAAAAAVPSFYRNSARLLLARS
jgi:tetratricopeptide (TPR) repeat protein